MHTIALKELHPKKIDVWCVFYDEIFDGALLRDYRACLSPEERQREQRFYFDKDKHRFLVTRALVRSVLSRYAAICPPEWEFSKNAFGMPLIDNCLSAAQKISFNISHTKGLIVLAVSTERAIGIDTENTECRAVALDVTNKYFSITENVAFQRLSAQLQHESFFQYWTLKESYIKARGMGLSIPLDQFSFDLTKDATIALAIAPELNDQATNWDFWQYRVCTDYTLALCVQRHDAGAPHISFKKIVPLVDESELIPHFMRQSNS